MSTDFLKLLEEEKKIREETDLSLRRRINSRYNSLTESINNLNNSQNIVYTNENQNITGIKTFTQSPIVPNIDLNDTNTLKAVNKKYCDDKVALLVSSAPSTLDTLQELANALGSDQNFATTMTNTLALKAPLSSPSFTDAPTAPTATAGTNNTQIATTAFVANGLNLKANLASPTFTGTPSAPTASTGNSTTQIATTAFVANGLNLKANLASPTFTGTPSAPTASTGTNNTQIATTAFVANGLNLKANVNNPTLTGAINFAGEVLTSKQTELYVTNNNVLNNSLSIDYGTSTSNIYSITPSSSNNIALSITNLPINRTAIYNFTFLINTIANKNNINEISINGQLRTMIGTGGLANINVNGSARLVIQNIYIQTDNSSVTNIITNVSSCF